jgi:hypothetical protein
VARQRFCPLQGIELVVFFWGVRGRAGTAAQERFPNARAGFFLAARGAETLLSRSPRNHATASGATHWRVTSGSIARGLAASIYICHRIKASSAGLAPSAAQHFLA